ncbi:MAG: substrate-binding domain-containing protein, partial [Mycobacterium sp.]
MLSGCGGHSGMNNAGGFRVECGGNPTIDGSGSTAQANAMTKFVDAYHKACGETLNYTANGSGKGVSEFLAGKTAFGGSDTPLAGDQYAAAKQRCGGSDAWNLPL